MNQLYRIEELYTNEWQIIDPSATKLTRKECDNLIHHYLSQGVNPNHLRAVIDND